MGDKIKRFVFSWLVVIAIVMVLRATFVEAMVIPSGSMEKTFLVGDAVLVNRFIYGVKIPVPFSNKQVPVIPGRDPKRGEIIAFASPFENKTVVKRCVAVAGDTVEILNKALYVNGEQMRESYTRHEDRRTFRGVELDAAMYQKEWEQGVLADLIGLQVRDNFGPVVVPEHCVFAMGDNRDTSFDSRFWGPLHTKHLKGLPLFVFFSFDPGQEGENLLDLIKIWQWKAIRLTRIGKVM
ncbi:MAG: signal peptidase I [candidate division WOR-3 bacterium]|nr:MAG: signal peptidase I [candidate division WOR-3 bacterium]